MLTVRASFNLVSFYSILMGLTVNMMPLFHVGGIVRNLFAPIMSGGSAIMCSGFDPIAFWTLASELKATWYGSSRLPLALLNIGF